MSINYEELIVHRGCDFNILVNVMDDYGYPYKMADYDFKCIAKPSYYNTRNAIEFEVEEIDESDGTFALKLNKDITSQIIYSKMIYTMTATDKNTGIVRSILEGTLVIYPTSLNDVFVSDGEQDADDSGDSEEDSSNVEENVTE